MRLKPLKQKEQQILLKISCNCERFSSQLVPLSKNVATKATPQSTD